MVTAGVFPPVSFPRCGPGGEGSLRVRGLGKILAHFLLSPVSSRPCPWHMRELRVISCTCVHGTLDVTVWSMSPWLPTHTSRSVRQACLRVSSLGLVWSLCLHVTLELFLALVYKRWFLGPPFPFSVFWDPLFGLQTPFFAFRFSGHVGLYFFLSRCLFYADLFHVSVSVSLLLCPCLGFWLSRSSVILTCFPMSPCLFRRRHPIFCWFYRLLHGHGPGGLAPNAVCGAAAKVGESSPTRSPGQLWPGVGESGPITCSVPGPPTAPWPCFLPYG